MRNVGDIKGVADIRTALSRHLRSTTRHKGSPYLEIFAFGMTRLRLERELEVIAKREERVRRHLDDALKVIEANIKQIQGKNPADTPAPIAGGQEGPRRGSSRNLTVGY